MFKPHEWNGCAMTSTSCCAITWSKREHHNRGTCIEMELAYQGTACWKMGVLVTSRPRLRSPQSPETFRPSRPLVHPHSGCALPPRLPSLFVMLRKPTAFQRSRADYSIKSSGTEHTLAPFQSVIRGGDCISIFYPLGRA